MTWTVITGASQGIGAGLAHALAAHGHTLLLLGRDEGRLRQVCAALPNSAAHRVFVGDLARDDTVPALSRAIAALGGPVGLLVNNAAIRLEPRETSERPPAGAVSTSLAVYRATLELNVFGCLRAIQAAMPFFAARSLVVNLTSELACLTTTDVTDAPAYSLSKFALEGLTLLLAADLAARAVDVVAVDPGWVRTQMGGPDAPGAVDDAVARLLPICLRTTSVASGGIWRP